MSIEHLVANKYQLDPYSCFRLAQPVFCLKLAIPCMWYATILGGSKPSTVLFYLVTCVYVYIYMIYIYHPSPFCQSCFPLIQSLNCIVQGVINIPPHHAPTIPQKQGSLHKPSVPRCQRVCSRGMMNVSETLHCFLLLFISCLMVCW